MDFARLTVALFPLLACGTQEVSVLESPPDAGLPMDVPDTGANDAAIPVDAGFADSGSDDTGVADTGIDDPCTSLADTSYVSLEFDSARSAPRTEARQDQFAVLRECDIT